MRNNVARLALIAVIALSRAATAQPDELKTLLDQNPTCKQWREVSRLTLARLRAANSKGVRTDPKLLETSFTIMDYCADELDQRLKSYIVSGLSPGEDAGRRAALALDAVIAYYKEALTSQATATSLKHWPAFTAAATSVIPTLAAIIDAKFGEGTFSLYAKALNTPEQSRTADEKAQLTRVRAWMESVK